jgi:hypothetical protein
MDGQALNVSTSIPYITFDFMQELKLLYEIIGGEASFIQKLSKQYQLQVRTGLHPSQNIEEVRAVWFFRAELL